VEKTPFPKIDGRKIGWISETEMIDVDRIMMRDLHIELIQMMENAGGNLARLVIELAHPRSVAVATGSGGNGGGGLVAARHLANAGVSVTVTTTRPADELTGVTAHQYDIIRRMGIEVSTQLADADVAIDAVLGYSLRGAPRGSSAALISAMSSAPMVVALDNPSGLDVTTGTAPGVVVSATATLTLALPKVGLSRAPQVGELFLADISVPPSVTARFGESAPDFSASSILLIN
jgi:NAD(P)H-hydrate epimerase